jgi:hypothetical protein
MFSRMSIFAIFLLLFASLLCDAQTATCTHWTFFKGFSPSGINDLGIVVGAAQLSGGKIIGVIRYANGDTKTYTDPNAAPPLDWTLFTRSNVFGATVGWYRDASQNHHGLLFSGSTAKTVDYPGAYGTILSGINDKGTMVGYWGEHDFSQPYYGFKMSKNGAVTAINVPGARQTNPLSITNNGVIAGSYVLKSAGPPVSIHGFVLSKGIYKMGVDYPHANRTRLNDINASGVIVGTYHNTSTGTQGGFLYVHGTFKEVKGPHVHVLTVDGINDYGYVTGTSSGGTFTAHCE